MNQFCTAIMLMIIAIPIIIESTLLYTMLYFVAVGAEYMCNSPRLTVTVALAGHAQSPNSES